MTEHYYSLNRYLRETFGEKVYKLALDGGMTCPNRDGSLGTGGCIFCSAGGSGDFAEGRCTSVSEQIERAKARVRKKTDAAKFIAYFQSYTNTYAPVEYLEQLFTEAMAEPSVAALSIGTRPDCLPDEVIDLLARLNRVKPVWVELGLQTIHETTARYIRRGYPLSVYGEGVLKFFTYCVPIALFQYYPFLYLIGRSDRRGLMLLPLVGLLFVIPCLLFFRFGLRRYQSTGS